jgi:4'-phosphopantetheinyl transferase
VVDDALDLCDDELHLWLVYEDEVHDSLLEDYRRVLSHDERMKEERFQFAADRRRHVITRALVRTVLSRYAGVPAEEWRFSCNAYGRPEIAASASAVPLAFNVAHSKGLIICGVSRARAIGVDTENVCGNRAPLSVARFCFSPLEVGALEALPRAAQHARFFEYWTLKESYIKALGKGLSMPLDLFSFDLEVPGRVGISFHHPLDDDPAQWRFWVFKPSTAHVVAVCARHATGEPELRLRVWETLPTIEAGAATASRLRNRDQRAREVRIHPTASRTSLAREMCNFIAAAPSVGSTCR